LYVYQWTDEELMATAQFSMEYVSQTQSVTSKIYISANEVSMRMGGPERFVQRMAMCTAE